MKKENALRKQQKKLSLNKETLTNLELRSIAGGYSVDGTCNSCANTCTCYTTDACLGSTLSRCAPLDEMA